MRRGTTGFSFGRQKVGLAKKERPFVFSIIGVSIHRFDVSRQNLSAARQFTDRVVGELG
jgi:hypothetical protein